MEKGLVSIITPCYNSAGYLFRLLDSVLNQDYPNIEMYAIDDGSTDNTREVIESYINKFSKKGYTLIYIYQENAGQSSAVNNGLKYVKGEYLTWPDSDDYYNCKDAISTFVSKLQSLPDDYAVVCYVGTFVDIKTQTDLKWNLDVNKSEQMFEICLLGGGMLSVPINYMVKMEAFDKVNPAHDIYTGQFVQNMQMLLPLFYSYKCSTVRQSLCNIVVRHDSWSHSPKTYKTQLEEAQSFLDIKLNTLDRILSMPAVERDKWKHLSLIRDLGAKQSLAIHMCQYEDARLFTKMLKENGETITLKTWMKVFLSKYPSLYRIVSK